MTPHPMPRDVQIVFSLALLASLAFFISFMVWLVRTGARKLYALFSETLDGCAKDYR